MHRIRLSLILAALALWIAMVPGIASTISPPLNLGELARASRAVVFAQAEGTHSEMAAGVPHTVTRFRLRQQVAGTKVSASFDVMVAGGEVGETGLAVFGAPRFEKGGSYLLFLDPAASGRWQPKILAYGVLREDEAAGVLRPVPEATQLAVLARPGIEPVTEYRSRDLLLHLSAVAAGAPWSRQAVATEAASPVKAAPASSAVAGAPLQAAPAACNFLLANDNLPVRWFDFEAGARTSIWHTTPGQTGISDGGLSAVQQGATVWTNYPNSIIHLDYAGTRPQTTPVCASSRAAKNGVNEVIFNDPCNEIPDLTACTGTLPPGWSSNCCNSELARGGVFYNPNTTRPREGDTWHEAVSPYVVVNNGAECVGETDFKEMMTHMLGHAVGFGHHNDNQATMYVQLGVHPPRGAALGTTDQICAEYAYHTFYDVPYNRWSWKWVEALENAGITKGCGSGNFCPTNSLTRAEMAVSLIRSTHGPSFVPPPASGNVFADVPASYWAAAHIEQLYADGLTKGCATNPLRYCPEGNLSRAEIVTLLMRVKHGSNFVPPPAQGIFSDVPANHWAIDNIEQSYRDGTTSGCGTNPLRFCPDSNVMREEMAAFLTKAFNFTLPAQ